MCDYSLDFVASRPAKVGDKLVSTQFNGSITRGFAAVGELGVAVCLLPGTELAFASEVTYRDWSVRSLIKARLAVRIATHHKTAIFRQLNKEEMTHHDALELPVAQVVLDRDLAVFGHLVEMLVEVGELLPDELGVNHFALTAGLP